MSTYFTTRATHTAMEDTICSNELCRENEAYFNGLRFLVNKKFQQFNQVIKKHTIAYKWRAQRTKTIQH
ncbi:hypothetical protein F6H22_08275 [Vibrio cholerae]|nr:hypothetical protein [Vibrio cholerae]EGQ9332221.1 hypothetical protein [Vibrio cholerae]